MSITRQKRPLYIEATHQQLDMKSDVHDTHKSAGVSARKHGETDVKSLVADFKDFVNPFQINEHSQNFLYCLSSGMTASACTAEDLLTYVSKGKQAAEDFIQGRLLTKQVDFHLPI